MKEEKTHELDCFYCGGEFITTCKWCDSNGKWKATQSTIDKIYEFERKWIGIY